MSPHTPALDIIVYGGVFDPPHLGHAEVIRTAQRSFPAAQMLVEVTIDPPHKRQPVATAAQRLGWVDTVFTGVEVLNPVIQQSPQYMIDTVRYITRQSAGTVPVGLLVGQDQWVSLPSWKDHGELIRLCHFLVVGRGDGTAGDDVMHEAAFTMLDMEPVEISSSKVREAAVAGDRQAVAGMVDPLIVDDVLSVYG